MSRLLIAPKYVRSPASAEPEPGQYVLTPVQRATTIPMPLFPRKSPEDEGSDVAAILQEHSWSGSDASVDLDLLSRILLQALQQRVEFAEKEVEVHRAECHMTGTNS